MKHIVFLILTILSLSVTSCKKDAGGCTDYMASNYDWEAEYDDGSCVYVRGCIDQNALNYNPDAAYDDGSCEYNCSCGYVTDDGVDGNGYFLTVRNACSNNIRTFYVDIDTWLNYFYGDYICFSNVSSW